MTGGRWELHSALTSIVFKVTYVSLLPFLPNLKQKERLGHEMQENQLCSSLQEPQPSISRKYSTTTGTHLIRFKLPSVGNCLLSYKATFPNRQEGIKWENII